MNGIPDECELFGTATCDCDMLGPCGNDAVGTGCLTSTGLGAFMSATGSSSVFSDDLVITVNDVPPNKSGIFFMGGSLINTPFGDGRRCVGSGGVGVRRFPVQNSGPGGSFSRGPGPVRFHLRAVPARRVHRPGRYVPFPGLVPRPDGSVRVRLQPLGVLVRHLHALTHLRRSP